jgi:hypothetical protein
VLGRPPREGLEAGRARPAGGSGELQDLQSLVVQPPQLAQARPSHAQRGLQLSRPPVGLVQLTSEPLEAAADHHRRGE